MPFSQVETIKIYFPEIAVLNISKVNTSVCLEQKKCICHRTKLNSMVNINVLLVLAGVSKNGY